MPEQKTVIKMGDYELRVSEFTGERKKIWFELVDPKTKTRLAFIAGTRQGDTYVVSDYRFEQTLPRKARAILTDNVLDGGESFLKQKGVKKITGKSDSRFARFLQRRKYKIAKKTQYGVTVERNLSVPLKRPTPITKVRKHLRIK